MISPLETRRLYLLASYPKSGNTWCRYFLVNYGEGSETPADIGDLDRIPLIASRRFVEDTTEVETSILTEPEAAGFRKEGMEIVNANLANRLILKVHDAYPCGDDPDWFPESAVAGVIYIVRNPLDIVKSLADHMGISIDEAVADLNDDGFAFSVTQKRLARQFRQTLHSWSGHVKSWLDGCRGGITLVRYEDLLADPFETFGKIVRAVDCEYDEERLKTAIRNSDFKVLKQDEEARGFKERAKKSKRFFREGKAGTWRKYLSDRNIRDIVEKHHEVMTRLGYLDENGKPVF